MYQIRDWLYVGSFAASRQPDLMAEYGIGAILQLAEKVWLLDGEVLFMEVTDGEPLPAAKIERGLNFIEAQKEAGKRVMVACGAGISRSVVFAMAALMKSENLDLFEAYRIVYEADQDAMPHHELCISVAAYFGQTLDLVDVWEGLERIQREVDTGRGLSP